MTNKSDFDPAVRATYWSSGDTRKACNGRANEVVMQKLGFMPIPDLSDVEAVQMGHVLEPVIGRLASQKLGVDLEKIESLYTHPKESWLRCHFDYVGVLNDKKILVECKNYNAAHRNKFNVDTGMMPSSDLGQLIHEAAVMGVDEIYLAILFGGQEFVMIKKMVSDEEKEQLIKEMAVYWAAVVTKQPLPPETSEQAKLLYPVAHPSTKTASQSVEEACRSLKYVKEQIKQLEDQKDTLETLIQGYMETNASLVSFDGKELASWKNNKDSMRFNSKLFQESMPDVYQSFVQEVSGPRVFRLK